MEEVVKWTSGRTGKMAKVEEVKGGLRVGGEADFAGESASEVCFLRSLM